MFEVRRECGHCQSLADHGFVFATEWHRPLTENDSRIGSGVTIAWREPMERVHGVALAACPLCGKHSLFLFACTRQALEGVIEAIGTPHTIFGGSANVEITGAYPEVETAHDHVSWPPALRGLFVDVQEMARQRRSPSITIAACRSVLEIAMKELGGEGRTLHDRIEDLGRKGAITDPLRRWAHHVRIEGNEAVHEIGGTHAEAVELVDFLRLFLDMTFTLPKRIADISSANLSG